MTNMTIATTILEQLGGRRFIAMTGSKNFVGGSNSLTFALPASMTKERANRMTVVLESSDTYTVKLLKYKPSTMSADVLKSQSDVYAEDLQEVFTTMTGLDTRL